MAWLPLSLLTLAPALVCSAKSATTGILLAGEALDDIIMDALGREAADGSETGQAEKSLFGQLQSTVQSLQRFARQLSQ